MRSGRLRYKFKFQKATTAQNAAGDTTRIWADVVTTFGDIRMAKGSEDNVGDKARSRITHTLLTRHRDDISNLNRIVWNGKVLNIVTVLADNKTNTHSMLIEAIQVNG